jgi:hypothetical protein
LEKYWEQQEVKAKELFELFGKKNSKDEGNHIYCIAMDSKVVVYEKE